MATMDEANNVPTNFPYKKLTPLPQDRAPSAAQIRQLKKELIQNAMSVPSNLGGGNHGHLGIVLTDAAYTAIVGAGAAWVDPNSPAVPNHGAAAAAHTIANANLRYTTNLKTFETCTTVARALKHQILEAVPTFTIEALEDDIYGYNNVLVREIVTHLETAYGTISEDDLAENQALMESAWDPDTPTEHVFARANKCRQFATAGNDAISDATSIRLCLAAFEKSGVMQEAIKDWRKKPAADRTWAAMPAHFKAANKERLRDVTAGQAGYQAANKATEQNKPKTAKTGIEGLHYCWTHGLGRNAEHTSLTCTKPAEGHQRQATAINMMGGNNTIRRSRGETAIYKRPERPNRANAATATPSEE